MDSTFGDIFLFLTDLAWKSRLTIPILVTTAFLVMDIRLQIEINIQSAQVNATDIDDDELDNLDREDEEEDTASDGFSSEYTNDEDENGNFYGYDDDEEEENEYDNLYGVYEEYVMRSLNRN